IDELSAQLRFHAIPDTSRPQCRIVPNTPFAVRTPVNEELLMKQKKALEDCYSAIRDGRIAEARKKLPSAEITLRNRYVRVKLCSLLVDGIYPVQRATLQPQQFELIVRLVNCALSHESQHDEHGIAYACLHFAWVYSRSLSQGVQQYLFTFWESAFFHDVHRAMRRQYISASEKNKEDDVYKIEGREDTWGLFKEPSAMELVAKRLMQWKDIDKEERTRLGMEEESIIFGAAKHYINLMIYLRIPLDTSRLRAIEKQKEKQRRHGTTSSDESSEDEGYVDDGRMGGITADVTKSIQNVVERLSSATGLSSQQVGQLTKVIPECIEMHVDTLEQVYIESSKLPPPPKLTISDPELCENERLVTGGLRCFLLNENDREVLGGQHLPAEGALFLTNYRVIFKGHPVDPYYADETVIRSAPVMSIVKEKIMDDIGSSSMLLRDIPIKTSRSLHHCTQIRTSTFACITVIFDEESTADRISEFSVALKAVRWPAHLPSTLICYANQSHLFAHLTTTEKHGTSTMGDLKRAITRLPNKMSTPFSTLLPDSHSIRKKDLLRDIRTSSLDKGGHEDFLDITGHMVQSRLSDYAADLRRLRFDADSGLLRISKGNKHYDLTASYPSSIVVPSSTADEILPKIAKGFKSNRLPVVTWTHERGAMLVRGAAFSTPNVVKRIKKQANQMTKEIGSDTLSMGGGGTPSSIRRPAPLTPLLSSAHQQETYLRRLVACSPTTNGEVLSGSFCSSYSYSQDSLKSSWTGSVLPQSSADKPRKPSSTAANFMKTNTARASLRLSQVTTSVRSSEDSENRSRSGPIPQRSMYIFGEKGANKQLRLDKNIEFIPLQFPTTHDVKESFKRFLKVTKPSVGSSSQYGKGFLVQLEESQWMEQIGNLLQTSSVIAALLSHFNSSVVLAIEDGRDATCQIASLVQIIADPHYRAFEGLQRLISKEWLAFGHRFSYRSNHSLASQKSGFAPIFIMFLDCLHQLMRQYPSAFEYNDFLLRFLAYHSQSTYFRTFLLDCESERCAVEKNVPDVKEDHCIWRFIKDQQSRAPIFTNFEYNHNHDVELEPRWSSPNLHVWSYYSEDFLAHGPPYDIEACLREKAKHTEERARISESKTTVQPEKVEIAMSSAISYDLEGQNSFIVGLERLKELCTLEGREVYANSVAEWKRQAEGLDAEDIEGVCVDERLPRRSLCTHTRRAVMKHLMKGKNPVMTSVVDRFPPIAASSMMLSPAVEQPEPDDRRASLVEVRSNGFAKPSNGEMPCAAPSKSLSVESSETITEASTPVQKMMVMNGCTPISIDENALKTSTPMYSPAIKKEDLPYAHSGFLFKKGATFKFWKQRWFVLDQRGIRMLYYDSPQDPVVKGEIELMDLESIDIIANAGVQKKGAAVLEIRTSRRAYSLMTNSVAEAEQWRVKIAEVV
ncbi:hypothetical protein PMAYCL1PPCAC_30812, partial [Pristionchus mayeri]